MAHPSLIRCAQDIFRKYPSNYEGIIPTLCSNLDDLDEPEAKASLIWILGEYAEKIDNADEILATFLESFAEDPFPVRRRRVLTRSGCMTEPRKQVQLQTLTAIVKLFLKKPDGTQGLVQRVLSLATKNCDSPDIRDRAYIYWRLLSTDPEATKVGRTVDRAATLLMSPARPSSWVTVLPSFCRLQTCRRHYWRNSSTSSRLLPASTTSLRRPLSAEAGSVRIRCRRRISSAPLEPSQTPR